MWITDLSQRARAQETRGLQPERTGAAARTYEMLGAFSLFRRPLEISQNTTAVTNTELMTKAHKAARGFGPDAMSEKNHRKIDSDQYSIGSKLTGQMRHSTRMRSSPQDIDSKARTGKLISP